MINNEWLDKNVKHVLVVLILATILAMTFVSVKTPAHATPDGPGITPRPDFTLETHPVGRYQMRIASYDVSTIAIVVIDTATGKCRTQVLIHDH